MGVVKYSGPVASFHCPTEATIRSLKVHFSPKQLGSGTPSPENVREIEGHNQIKVELGSENLTQFSSGTTTWYKPVNFSSDYVTYYGFIDNTLGNTNVKLAARPSIGGTFYSDAIKPGERGAVYIKLRVSSSTSVQLKISNASTNTVVQQRGLWPYIEENNKLINFDETIYGGYVDLVTGELVEEWTLFEPNENSDIYMLTNDSFRQFRFQDAEQVRNRLEAYCSHYQMVANPNVYGLTGLDYLDYACQLIIQNTEPTYVETVDELKQWLVSQRENGTPFQIVFRRKNPISHQLTSQQLETLIGQNNIWSNADYVEVEYDLHETQDILAHKQFIIANQPHIIKLAAAPLQNFVTDMVAPLKECKVHFEPKQDLHGYSKPWVGGAGKNLFNINATEQNPDDTTAANTTARNFTAGTYCVGTSWSNWLQPNQVLEHSVSNSILSIKNNNVYGVGYALKIQSETNYAISATSSNGGINAAFYDASGNFISGLSTNILNTSFATPVDATIVVLTFYNRTEGSDAAAATFSNIQFEKRSSITSYEPWENICPISGQTGVELYRTGKNIFPSEEDADKHPLFIRQGTQLTASSQMADGRNDRIEFYTKNKMTRIDYWNLTQIYKNSLRHYRSFTMASSANPYPAEWFRFSFGGNEQQIEFGSVATDYEPYTGTTIPITFPSEAGTVYGGYIDLINGELVQTHYVATIDEKTNITQERTSHGVKTEMYHLPYTGTNKNAISTNGYGIRERSSASWNYPTASKLYLYPDDANVTSVVIGIPNVNMTQVEWVDWLSAHGPIQVYYELAEPIRYTIDPQILKSLRGTNNIWSNANGNIELSYWKH